MSRRCKVGQRARIIGGRNRGQVVLVVRPYVGERINGTTWPEAVFPWVVTSLGRALDSVYLDTRLPAPAAMTIVVDDEELEPLRDDDHGIGDAEDVGRPVPSARRVLVDAGGNR